MDEQALIARLPAGDREALSRLLMAHREACYALALRLVGRAEDAEDVCQDAFLRASRDAAGFRPTAGGSFRSWLFGLVVCAHRDRLRSERARRRREGERAMELETTTVSAADKAEQPELRRRLDASLKALGESRALPIILHYERGLSHAETAAALAMPEGTVKTNIRRGLEELRSLLARDGYGALGLGVLEGMLSQAPAVLAPASLTAFVKSLAAGGSAAAKGCAAVTTASAGGLAIGWKIAGGAALAALLAFGGNEAWKRWHSAAGPKAEGSKSEVGPAPTTAEAELEAILARPAAIRLSNESVETWLPELVSRHDIDCAWPKDLWTWETRITASHKGTVRGCLEKLAEAAGTKVSFDAGMVRFWRPADPATVKALAARLAGNDEQERCVAVWRLAWLGDPEAVGLVLKPALEDSSPAVRYWAMRGLERLAHDDGAPPLLPLDPPGIDRKKWVGTALASEEKSTCLLAHWAAGVWRVLPDDGAALLAHLKDGGTGDSAVKTRTAAAWALGRCRFAPAREPLVEFLCTARGKLMNSEVEASARAIDRLGLRDLPDRLLRQVQDGPGAPAKLNAMRALGELRWAPAEAAIRKTVEADASLGWAASLALPRITPPQQLSVVELERIAAQDANRDWQAKRAAFGELEELDTPESREALVRLADKDIHCAGAALIRLGDKRAADLVLKKAAEMDNDKRWVAIRLIPRLPAEARTREAVGLLFEALRSPGNGHGASMTRQAAATALGELDDEAAVPLLAGVLRGKDSSAHGQATRAMGRIGTPIAQEELLKLWTAKAEPDAIKAELNKTMLKSGLVMILDKPGVLEEFFAAIKDDRAMSHNPCFGATYTPRLADALTKYLDNPDRKLQILAVKCLGEWGLKCPEGVPAAIRLLGELDQAEDMRDVAMALGSFGGQAREDPRAVAAALRLLAEKRDRPGAESLCDLLGKGAPTPEVVAALTKMAGKGNDIKLRGSAVKGLGQLKPPGAAEILIDIVNETAESEDPKTRGYHDRLRNDAAASLGKIGGPQAVAPLLKMLKEAKDNRGSLIRDLARIGDERAVPALLEELRKGDKFWRRWTSSALRHSPLAARPEVAAALEDYRKHNPDGRPDLANQPQPEPEPFPAPPEVF